MAPWMDGPLWASLGSALMLWVFYLGTPVISSRYISDFAPAFAILSLLAADAFARRLASVRPLLGWIGMVSVMGWWASRAGAIREVFGPPTALTGPIISRKMASKPTCADLVWPDGYRLGDPCLARRPPSGWPDEVGGGLLDVRFNGVGWNFETGATMPWVALFVTMPEFDELEIAVARVRTRRT